MKKYRKKPVVIEAVKLTRKNILEVYSEIYAKPKLDSKIAQEKWYDFENIVESVGINIPTNEGNLKLTMGNYLVKGYSKKLGYHYWPVDADYFKQNYELKIEHAEDLEAKTERNMEVVCSFMEHYKNETENEIQESVFLSFFNA